VGAAAIVAVVAVAITVAVSLSVGVVKAVQHQQLRQSALTLPAAAGDYPFGVVVAAAVAAVVAALMHDGDYCYYYHC
jgi:hypothetical protein